MDIIDPKPQATPKEPFHPLIMVVLGAFLSLIPNLFLLWVADTSDMEHMLGYYPVTSWAFVVLTVGACILGDPTNKVAGVRKMAFGALLMTVAMHLGALPRPF